MVAGYDDTAVRRRHVVGSTAVVAAAARRRVSDGHRARLRGAGRQAGAFPGRLPNLCLFRQLPSVQPPTPSVDDADVNSVLSVLLQVQLERQVGALLELAAGLRKDQLPTKRGRKQACFRSPGRTPHGSPASVPSYITTSPWQPAPSPPIPISRRASRGGAPIRRGHRPEPRSGRLEDACHERLLLRGTVLGGGGSATPGPTRGHVPSARQFGQSVPVRPERSDRTRSHQRPHPLLARPVPAGLRGRASGQHAVVLVRRVARRALRATQSVCQGTDVCVAGRSWSPGLAHRANQAAVPGAGVAAAPVSHSAQQERSNGRRSDVDVVFDVQDCGAPTGGSEGLPQGLPAPTLTKALSHFPAPTLSVVLFLRCFVYVALGRLDASVLSYMALGRLDARVPSHRVDTPIDRAAAILGQTVQLSRCVMPY